MSLRLCMIGCGSFARQFHGPAQERCARENAAIERVACCDTAIGRARDYAESFGYVRSYDTAREMLDRERPDAVIMAVPPTATADAAAAVLELGFPLLLEKPPGTTRAELERLRSAARRGHVRAQVGFNRRHMPVVREALATLRREFRAGEPLAITYEMARHERWDPDFTTTAIHAVDAAAVLAGTPFREVELRFEPHFDGERRATDVTMDFIGENGTRVRVDVRPVAGVNAETAVIHGRGQTLRLTVPFPSGPVAVGRLEHWRGNACVAMYADATLDPLERMGICDETRAFFAAIRTGGPMTPELADCVQQVAVMELLRAGQAGRFTLPAD